MEAFGVPKRTYHRVARVHVKCLSLIIHLESAVRHVQLPADPGYGPIGARGEVDARAGKVVHL